MGALNIIGLCGSLDQGSINHAALRLAAELMPDGTIFELAEWRDLPLHDHVAPTRGMPSAVTALALRLARADGRCIDEPTRKFSADQMTAFASWIGAARRLGGAND